MSFSTWMSARGRDVATFTGASKDICQRVSSFTKKTVTEVGDGFSAFKTGYQLKRVDTLCNQGGQDEQGNASGSGQAEPSQDPAVPSGSSGQSA